MSSLADLAIELIQHVAAFLNAVDQAALRATNTYLQDAVDPLLCSVVFIPTNRLRSPKTSAFVDALENGSTSWSRYGRRLHLGRTITPRDSREPITDQLPSSRLASALLSCAPRTRAVRYVVTKEDPEWLYQTVCDAIVAFPLLQRFDLLRPHQLGRALPRLARLSTLKISSAIAPVQQQPLAFWHPLVDLPPPPLRTDQLELDAVVAACPGLHTLELISADAQDVAWETLLQLGICLRQMTINRITPAVLAYLKSYSGLEVFVLQRNPYDQRDPPEMDPLAREFFEEVLPMHETTLRVLRCPMAYENAWSIGSSEGIDVLRRLANLTQLEMSLCHTTPEEVLLSFFKPILRLHKLEYIALTPALSEAQRRSSALATRYLPVPPRPKPAHEDRVAAALRVALSIEDGDALPDVSFDHADCLGFAAEFVTAQEQFKDMHTDVWAYRPGAQARNAEATAMKCSVWVATVSRR
ncbi:hypothetical protein HMN09_01107900 [Mycena chlorophos]|uniref:F-box domain-containing protein n=1 Tax=Mycena chlorophos TaxID=658473 RepID=A0A8H6SCH0_MYCCL|nr:hypothetical protein HMN09_01107900 [Mycena chlorophos]